MKLYPEIKNVLINKILDSPFDEEREFFMDLCKKYVPWFSELDDR